MQWAGTWICKYRRAADYTPVREVRNGQVGDIIIYPNGQGVMSRKGLFGKRMDEGFIWEARGDNELVAAWPLYDRYGLLLSAFSSGPDTMEVSFAFDSKSTFYYERC